MSTKKYKKVLFIFRRDLRLYDNSGLIEALKQSEVVIPIFILDPRQVGSRNKYKSDNALQYMLESLVDLSKQLKQKKGKLYIFYGEPSSIIKKIIPKLGIEAVFVNSDYTPFSRDRDAKLADVGNKLKISFYAYHDLLLIGDPAVFVGTSGKPYMKYSAFLRRALKNKVLVPQNFSGKWHQGVIPGEKPLTIFKKILPHANARIKVHGGRSAAEKIVRNIRQFKQYAKERDIPSLDATTHLSAAHKFGTVSVRETYHAVKNTLGPHSLLLQELYWRDFFTYLAYHFPRIFGKPLQKKYESLKWSYDKKRFNAWCTGTTGFPIVDAGMRQLNTTGWVHNRVRMIVASFLIKDLHINWLDGERYFATKLVDYDPAVNNGNWQWVASTGADTQPYFRIFNPWLQQKKFDPKCEYIKQWVPELRDASNAVIHTWYEQYAQYKNINYPEPIVDHTQEKVKSLSLYKKVI